MDDLVSAVVTTAAVPGLLLGLWASIRSGIPWTLLGMIIGLIGGLIGGFGLPAVGMQFNLPFPDGPLTMVIGSLLGALVLLLLTSGLRKA